MKQAVPFSPYAQRNALVVAFAHMALAMGWEAGRGIDKDPTKDWDDDWRHVVYVDLPNGEQVSWHIAPTEVYLLDSLPKYQGEWNGKFTARDLNWVEMFALQFPHHKTMV